MLWKPATASCGHTFCQVCLTTVLDFQRRCPVCRENYEFDPNGVPICVPIEKILEHHYPNEYALRADDVSEPSTPNERSKEIVVLIF